MRPKAPSMDAEPDKQVRPDEPDERIARQLSVSDVDRAESGEAAALIAVREAAMVRRWPDALRWGTCLALALCVHAAGAAALLLQWSDSADSVASAPVILIELAPVPVTPDTMPSQLPPGPREAESQPETEPQRPIEKAEIKTDLAKEAELPAMPAPVEKPKEKKQKQRHASLARAPSTAERRAERAAAPTPGAALGNPDALPNWKSALVARLERYKRYPPEAQSRGEYGVAQLAFSVDRSGGVHYPHITRSSGSSLLDRETVALVERASPMPPPPPEVAGAQIPIVVPIRYNTR
jgi:protein TonB